MDAEAHQKAHQWLHCMLENDSIPHALIFSGIKGVGKQTMARAFAMTLNCYVPHNGPCGKCRPCRKILSGNHPDYHHIIPQGPLIKIERIRELINILSMKPYEATIRVIIIAEAQTMNPEAGNALLKLLEEPPDKTIFILTVMEESDLLSTIISRCQSIRFSPVPANLMTSMLVSKYQINPDKAALIASLAQGSYLKAFQLAESSEWLTRRNWLLAMLPGLGILQDSNLRMETLSLISAEQLAGLSKEILGEVLEILKTWLRDLVMVKDHPEHVINLDLIPRLKKITGQITISTLITKINAVHTAQKQLISNSNVRLTMEFMVIKLLSL